jgi:hypothetical protein
MQKVVDYKLVSSKTTASLTSAVTTAMAEDWVPSGTVIVFNGHVVQAMVRFEAA